MPVTPLDILQKKFGAARRAGYEPDEVHRFLDEVRESLEAVLRENLRLREDLVAREADLARMRAESGEIKEALVMARRMVNEMEATARREADMLIGEARLEAERVLATAHDERRDVQEQIVRLRSARLYQVAELRALLKVQQQMLDELEREG